MSKQSGYARNIIFSLVFSIVILLVIGFLSVKYLVPIYDIKSQDIYKFMIYLLPILIGLALIEIGAIIASKNSTVSSDAVDLLPKNSYDSPMYSIVNDDPSLSTIVPSNNEEFIPIEDEKIEQLSNQSSSIAFEDEIEDDFEPIMDEVTDIKPVVFENLDEETINILNSLSQAQITEALECLENGCPQPQDENCVVLPNLDNDTLKLLSSFSKEEINEAINLLVNVNEKEKLLLPFDEDINNALLALSPVDAQRAIDWINAGCLESEILPFDVETTEKISNLNQDEINLALDWLERGAPQGTSLPFGDDLNSAIKKFTPKEASAAVDFVLNNAIKKPFVASENEKNIKLDGSLDSVLEEEIFSSKEMGYDLTLVLIKDFSLLEKGLQEEVESNTIDACYSFNYENDTFALLFPMFNKDETAKLLEKNLPLEISYSIASIGKRSNVSKEKLIKEAMNCS